MKSKRLQRKPQSSKRVTSRKQRRNHWRLNDNWKKKQYQIIID